MQINNLIRKTKLKKTQRVGRGGKRGKTSGRGTKGQLARAGRKLRPELRDIIKKLPKLRGRGRNFLKTREKISIAINVSRLSEIFKNGDTVSPETLVLNKVITTKKSSVFPVKILGEGEIDKKLIITGCRVSASAKEKIEKAGGSVK
ncbi:MAG: 50S ribosomal protein L15 [Patescibacteria group bacterium]